MYAVALYLHIATRSPYCNQISGVTDGDHGIRTETL